jgi:hypothetical protein
LAIDTRASIPSKATVETAGPAPRPPSSISDRSFRLFQTETPGLASEKSPARDFAALAIVMMAPNGFVIRRSRSHLAREEPNDRSSWDSMMPLFIFDLVYHEFIRARLAEMRKQLFLIRRDVPVVDTDQSNIAADQGEPRHEAKSAKATR